jgi:hypothetical protein
VSSSRRIQIGIARQLAGDLFNRWGMSPATCMIVGSVRRNCPDVGDLEFTAPLPAGDADPLYDKISGTLIPTEGLGLFDCADAEPSRIGWANRGFKPGFAAASITVKHRIIGMIAVEIYRYTGGDQGNRGWVEIMRTGPRDFCTYFLDRWKTRHGIARDKHALVENQLRDMHGYVIPVPTEARAFELAGMDWVEPDRRGIVAEAAWKSVNRRSAS